MRFIAGVLLTLILQDVAAPLPEAEPFIAEFQKALRSDEELLRQYTYVDTETKVNPRKTEVSVYQVLLGPDGRPENRRLIEKNGKSVPPKDEKIKKRDPANDDKVRAELFQMYDIQILRRDFIEGRAAIVLSFRARPEYKPKSKEAETLKHIEGQVWVEENEHQVMRLEAEVQDPISFGFGLLAKIKKGTHITAERKKINDEIWLPSRVDIDAAARVLFFGVNVQETHTYSDYKKFGSTTTVTFGEKMDEKGKGK